MNADVTNTITRAVSLVPSNISTNTNTSSVDIKDFQGIIAAHLSTGVQAGNDVVIQAFLQHSPDNGNWSNCNVSFTNVSAANISQTVSVDTRQTYGYLRGRLLIAGNNTPAQMCSLVFSGAKQSRP